jgi:hypothetical protein
VIALALAATLASPFAGAFWSRDLGSLARGLAEARTAGTAPVDAPLFEDLLRLVRCEPLPPLPADAPDGARRALLRLEQARRARLGPAAATAPTIWRDVVAPGFFRTDTRDPARGADALRWPAEAEEWPDEVLLVGTLATRCAEVARAAAPELPSDALAPALARAGDADGAARIAYHRAVLLVRARDDAAAREAARAVDPDAVPAPLRNFARLLRLEAGVDPAQGYVALADAPDLGDAWLAVAVRAAALHARAGRAAEALALAERAAPIPCEPARAAAVRVLRVHRAAALASLGRPGESVAALREAFACQVPPPDPDAAALSELAIALVATRPLAEVEDVMTAAAPREAAEEALWAYARRATSAGNLAGAEDAARRLERGRGGEGRLRAVALRAEVAFARGDGAAFESALAALLEAPRTPRQRLERDRLALDLGAAAAVRVAEVPDRARARALEAALDRMALAVAVARTAEVERIRAAVANAARADLARPDRGAVPLALGEVSVAARPTPPPTPRVPVVWPEPRSLLVIPTAEGGTRDWFPSGAVASGSTP